MPMGISPIKDVLRPFCFWKEGSKWANQKVIYTIDVCIPVFCSFSMFHVLICYSNQNFKYITPN